eukprot:3854396-Amphidinium_carterae.1
MDTEAGTVAVPAQRLTKAAHLLALPVYSTGNKAITLRELQRLRGTAQSWCAVMPGIRLVLRAVDVFLTPREESDHVQPQPSVDAATAWQELWSAIEIMRFLVGRPEVWKDRFLASMNRLLTVPEQLGLPGALQQLRVVSSDATLEVHGAVDWTAGITTRHSVTEFAKYLVLQQEDLEVSIAIAELMGLVAFAAGMGSEWQNQTVLYAGDNMNTIRWLTSRAPRPKMAQLMVKALMCLEARYRFCVHPFFIRTYHNRTPDWISRATAEEYEKGIVEQGFRHLDVTLPWQEALTQARNGSTLFLIGMEVDDMRVQHLQLVADTPTEDRLDSLADLGHRWQFVDKGGEDGDFHRVWRSLGIKNSEAFACKTLHVGTLPADPSGVRAFQWTKLAIETGADAVLWEGPACTNWERTEKFLEKKGWKTTTASFESTACGAAVWRKRAMLYGCKTEVPILREFPIQDSRLVTGTAARLFMTPAHLTTSAQWVTTPDFSLQPQLGRIYSPSGPRAAGYLRREGQRLLVPSIGSPIPAPKVQAGCIEATLVWDPAGEPGLLRSMTPSDWVSLQQASRTQIAASEKEAVTALKGTGIAVASALILYFLQHQAADATQGGSTLRSGAGLDLDDEEILFAMREWLNAWRRGVYPPHGSSASITTQREHLDGTTCEECAESCGGIGALAASTPATECRCGGTDLEHPAEPRQRRGGSLRAARNRAAIALIRPGEARPEFPDVQGELDAWLADRLGYGLAETTRR